MFSRQIPKVIRVVRIIDRLNIGGPAKHVVWLTAGLDRQEFEPTLVTGTVPGGEGDMNYFAEESGVQPIVVEEMSRELSPLDVIVVFKLLRLLFKLKPDIIHTHKAKAGATGRAAAFIYRSIANRHCAIVHTYHGHIFHSYYGPLKTQLFIAIERLLAVITDRIITVSEQQRREICDDFRIGSSTRHRVIPLGLDLESNSGSHRHRDNEELAIGIVGRLSEVKNHGMLLEAIALLNGHVKAKFLIIGDGHLRKELVAQAERLSIAQKVTFTGFRKDALSLYADLDLVVLTSLNEGTPLTLIEAMSNGRAVAATEVGGVVDLMGARLGSRDGFSIWDHGVTVPSRDVAALARAIEFMASHPDERREMGERARRFVRERYSKERLVGDIENLYRELVINKRGTTHT
jgi:glycosyltransferase involved in cell wall biosynthesis